MTVTVLLTGARIGDDHMTVTWQSHLPRYLWGWRWSVLCSEVWDCQKSILSSVLLAVWRGRCEVLGHVCGCVLGEGNVKWWIQPPGETVLYGLSIFEPHLRTFHALFCALKIGLIIQVYPEVGIIFLWSFQKLQLDIVKVTRSLIV